MTFQRHKLSVDDYVDGILRQDRAILARAITLVESQKHEHQVMAEELLTRLLPATGKSHRIGISGVPGVGKSTFINAFGTMLIEQGHKVAVLAIDPSSHLSGGSILGDKTRMSDLAASPHAFIRPSPSACTLGGVARRTRETMLLCEAAGFDIVLIETVGVGQSEISVTNMVDTFLVLMLAGAGDELQGIKKGILEIADVLAITKADGDNIIFAEKAASEYKQAFHYVQSAWPEWEVPVLTCSALAKKGLDQVWDALKKHKEMLEKCGKLQERRQKQMVDWMWALMREGLERAFLSHPAVQEKLAKLEKDVQNGATTPVRAAWELLLAFGVNATS